MKKNLINEVSRIQELMGKSIISEQALPNVLKNIFTDFSDDALRKIFKTFDSDIDNAVNAIKRGDTVSDDIIVKLIKNLDFESISKIIFDNKLLGTQFDSNIDEAILFLKNNPKNYDSVIEQFNNTIDKLTYLRGAPPELVQSLKNELKNIIDDGVRASSKITDSGDNITSLLSKRLRTQADVHNEILDALNVKNIQDLRQIPEISPLIKKATDKMVGKTLGEIQKDFNKIIDEIQSNPNFKKFYETYYDTPWDTFIKGIKSIADSAVIADKRNWIPFFGEGKFGQRIVNPETGVVEKSIPASVLKSLTLFLAADLALSVLNNYYLQGKTSGESFTIAFSDSYLSIIGATLGIVSKKVEERRSSMGELTIDEVKTAFTPTVSQLGRDINEYDFEKLHRGVWKVVDVDGDVNGVQTHYVVIKNSGEITVVPFSETEGVNWGSDLTDWLNGIKQKYGQ